MTKEITQEQIVKEFYQNNPNRDVTHPEVVDWVIPEYFKITAKVFR